MNIIDVEGRIYFRLVELIVAELIKTIPLKSPHDIHKHCVLIYGYLYENLKGLNYITKKVITAQVFGELEFALLSRP